MALQAPPQRLVVPSASWRTKKRKREAQLAEGMPVWVATTVDDEGSPCSRAAAGKQWYIVGFAHFQHVELFGRTPSPRELSAMEQMRASRWVGAEKYACPVAVVVDHSGWLENPIHLPDVKGIGQRATVALPRACRDQIDAAHCEDAAWVAGSSKWKVFKAEIIAQTIQESMRREESFRWPMFPSALQGLGLDALSDTLPFHPPLPAEPEGGAEAEAEDEGDFDHDEVVDSDDDAADRKQGRRIEPPLVLLKYLRFRSFLRSSEQSLLRGALELAGDILGMDPELVRDRVRGIPHRTTLERAQLKLDMLMMHFSRWQWHNGMQGAVSLMADSSEQKRVDFFMQRSDVLAPPLIGSEGDHVAQTVYPRFFRQVLPVALVGHGEKDVAHKAAAMLHTAKMLCGSHAALGRWGH